MHWQVCTAPVGFVRQVGKATRQFHSGDKLAACLSLDGMSVSHQGKVNFVSKLVRHVGQKAQGHWSKVWEQQSQPGKQLGNLT